MNARLEEQHTELYFVSVQRGDRVVVSVKRHYRTGRIQSVDARTNPRHALRMCRADAESLASECGGVAEPVSAMLRFY